MSTPILPKAIKAAYRSSPQFDLDKLLAERSRWQRKQTIAINKLAGIQRRMDKLTQSYVNTLMGKDKHNENQ